LVLFGYDGNAQGLGNMVMFCGDGINDLTALRKADMGYAVGASDATVAASISTSHKSVAGQHYHSPVTLCCQGSTVSLCNLTVSVAVTRSCKRTLNLLLLLR